MDFKEVGLTGVDDIHLVQDIAQWRAILKTVMNLPFTYTSKGKIVPVLN
jgi:hypothetical protein